MVDFQMFEGTRGGKTFNMGFDYARLNAQHKRVYGVMKDGLWHTLRGISNLTGDPEASISARLRDFRKEKFGGWELERMRVTPGKKGLWAYRLVPGSANSEIQS